MEIPGLSPAAVPVPMPALRRRRPRVAPAPKRCLELPLDQVFDEGADPAPDAGLDRVESGLPREWRPLGGRPVAAILVHGVVSAGAPTPVMAR